MLDGPDLVADTILALRPARERVAQAGGRVRGRRRDTGARTAARRAGWRSTLPRLLGVVRCRLRMPGEQLARGNRLACVALVQAAIANPEVLAEWLAERKQLAVDVEQLRKMGRALFVGRGGRRLAKRSADDVVRGLGKDAGVKLSAHALRHTFLSVLVRNGRDLVTGGRAGWASVA